MLMDEPFFRGLDVRSCANACREETLSLLRETRATCLIVTHAPARGDPASGDRIAVGARGPPGASWRSRRGFIAIHAATICFVGPLFSEINEIPLPPWRRALHLAPDPGAFADAGSNQ